MPLCVSEGKPPLVVNVMNVIPHGHGVEGGEPPMLLGVSVENPFLAVTASP